MMTKRSWLRAALLVPLLVGSGIAHVLAACGHVETPTYSDIYAIWYERTNCFGKCVEFRYQKAATPYRILNYILPRPTGRKPPTSWLISRASTGPRRLVIFLA
jgi:hypothetical protein